jgi:hypothetical protein
VLLGKLNRPFYNAHTNIVFQEAKCSSGCHPVGLSVGKAAALELSILCRQTWIGVVNKIE